MEIKQVTNEKWLNLFEIEGNSPWLYASRKKNITKENFQEKVKAVDAIVIVPYMNEKVILIEQWREPIQNIEISFPAGLMEEGISLEENVRRELKEETGLDLVSIDFVSPQLFSSSGLTDESVKIVWCSCSGEISLDYQEKDEGIVDIIALDFDEVQHYLHATKTDRVFGAKAYIALLQLATVMAIKI